jgi:hypothetical protein
MHKFGHLFRTGGRLLFSLVIALSALGPAAPAQPVYAAAALSVTPLTWNIIGLDSNNVNVGPNHFPVGARVCNTGDAVATNVKSAFNWTSSDPYIALRPGTSADYTANGLNLNPAQCTDFYYEVEVTRDAAAYNHTRRYTITASADGGLTGSTPTPRELFVEHLISQNRNVVTTVKLDGVAIPSGGSMVLTVGNTYSIQLVGSTATNGYNQLESFISLPNTIFQILSVSSTYSVSSLGSPIDKLYADACGWDNNPLSPTYRSCIGSDGKAGGDVTTSYVIKIIGGGGTQQSINTLLYDFSGSSYHYNSDFSSSTRIASIIDPASATITKSFTPATTVAGGLSTLNITLSNPTASPLTDVNFTDPLPASPGQMVVANPPLASTSGCGTPVFAPVAGATSLSFAQGTIAANSACVISVRVSVPASPTTGVYTNTTNSLFIGLVDTGHTAAAALTVAAFSGGTGVCNLTLAQWTMPIGDTNPPTPTTKASDVLTATASPGQGLTGVLDTSEGNPLGSLRTFGYANAGPIVTGTSPYYQFAVDTSQYTQVALTFDASRKNPGPDSLFLYYSTNGTTWTQFNGSAYSPPTSGYTTFGPLDFTGLTAAGTTYFRFYAFGALNPNIGADLNFDNVTVTGCGVPQPLIITKAFTPNPIAVNSTSVLTFSVVNSNSVQVTGVRFTDDLPAGVQVASPPAASTSGCGAPTFAPSAGDTSLTFSGGTIAASSRCNISVTVTALTAGPHLNLSGVISSTETGPNTGNGGSATAALIALQPPQITKNFVPDPILAGGTSLLTFVLLNPNPDNALSGVAFTDNLPTTPGAMQVANPPGAATSGCGAPVFAPAAGAITLSFSGAAIAASGLCLVTVTVTALATGIYTNTTSPVTATVSGVTITNTPAVDSLTANTPNPAIALAKHVAITTTGPWTSFLVVVPGTDVYYRLTIENIGDVPLSPVSVSDPNVDLTSCVWPVTLPVASPTQDPTATCILGPLPAQSGDVPNTATAQGVYTSTVEATANAEYLGAVPGLNLIKQVALSATGPWASWLTGVPAGADLYYKFIVVNNGQLELNTLIVTDAQVDTTGCTLIDPLAIGGATNCVVGPVTAETVMGTYTNTATVGGRNGAIFVTSDPAEAAYTLSAPDLTLTKTNDTGGAAFVGVPFVWTLTVANAGDAPVVLPDGEQLLTDPLPAGATYGVPSVNNPVNITNVGNLLCAITANTLACAADGAAVTIDVGGSLEVALTVTPTATGSLDNTATVDPGEEVAESDEENNTGTDSVSVTEPGATVGGLVWIDLNQDGQQTGGEPGIPLVLVTLDTGSGLLTTTTDASGLYTFTNLISGTFRLTFTAPSGFTPTVANVGNDATDSDADPGTGGTGPFNLVTGQVDKTWSAGYWQAPTVIELVSFTAAANGQGGVTLSWTTAVEIDTAGYNLYRAGSPGAPLTQINALLIAATGSFGAGADYSANDWPGAGHWWYWLEDVDTQGHRTLHGPVTVTVGGGPLSTYRLYLPLAGK